MGNLLSNLPDEVLPEYHKYTVKGVDSIKDLIKRFWGLHNSFGFTVHFPLFVAIMQFKEDQEREACVMYETFARHKDHIHAIEFFISLLSICRGTLQSKVRACVRFLDMDGLFSRDDVHNLMLATARGMCCLCDVDGWDVREVVGEFARKFFQSNVSFHGNKLTRSELFRAAMREPAIIQFFCRFGTEDAEEQLARCRKLQTAALRKPGFHFHSYGALRPKSAGPLSSCKSSQLLRPPHGQDQRPATAIAGFRVKTTPDKVLLNSFSAKALGIAPLRAGKTAPLGLRSTSPLKLDKTLSPPKKLFKKTLRPHQRLHPHPTFKPSRAHADRKERISKRTQQLSLKVSKACIRLHQPGIFAVKLNTERAKVIKNLFSELDVKGKGRINLEDISARGMRLRSKIQDTKDINSAFLNKSMNTFTERPMVDVSFRDCLKFVWPHARKYEKDFIEFVTDAPPVTQRAVSTMQQIFETLDGERDETGELVYDGEVDLVEILQMFKGDPVLALYTALIKIPDDNTLSETGRCVDLDRLLHLIFASTHPEQMQQILGWVLRITPEQEHECEQLFAMYDDDDSGVITMKCFTDYLTDNGLTQKSAAEVIEKLGNTNGCMTLREFIKYKRQSWANDTSASSEQAR